MNDLLFCRMPEDRAFCEEILQVILSDPDLAVPEYTPQYDATNLQRRSAAFDARCILSSGKQVITGVQRACNDHHQKRVRYNSTLQHHRPRQKVPGRARRMRRVHFQFLYFQGQPPPVPCGPCRKGKRKNSG